jgi:hypothetical protein
VSTTRVAGAVLLAVLAAGCAREVSPGIQDARTQRAEAARHGGDVDIPRYHEAAQARALGQVAGRVYAERRKPDGPDTPLTGTTLMALPRSATLLGALESIRLQSRESLDRYREAAPAVRREREAFERALLERGGGDLAQTVDVGADGTFTLPALPAGDWVLLAVHTEPGKNAPIHTRTTRETGGSAAAADRFLPRSKLVGHHYVTFWLRELTVTPGEAATVSLTDRNAWLTGVVEDRETPVFRVSPPVSTPGAHPSAPGVPSGGAGTGSTLSPAR